MDVTIIADQGTHLLIGRANRFAVIERRNNRLYSCHDGKRESVALDNISAIATVLNDADWTDEATAQATFEEIVARGNGLSETIR